MRHAGETEPARAIGVDLRGIGQMRARLLAGHLLFRFAPRPGAPRRRRFLRSALRPDAEIDQQRRGEEADEYTPTTAPRSIAWTKLWIASGPKKNSPSRDRITVVEAIRCRERGVHRQIEQFADRDALVPPEHLPDAVVDTTVSLTEKPMMVSTAATDERSKSNWSR